MIRGIPCNIDNDNDDNDNNCSLGYHGNNKDNDGDSDADCDDDEEDNNNDDYNYNDNRDNLHAKSGTSNQDSEISLVWLYFPAFYTVPEIHLRSVWVTALLFTASHFCLLGCSYDPERLLHTS